MSFDSEKLASLFLEMSEKMAEVGDIFAAAEQQGARFGEKEGPDDSTHHGVDSTHGKYICTFVHDDQVKKIKLSAPVLDNPMGSGSTSAFKPYKPKSSDRTSQDTTDELTPLQNLLRAEDDSSEAGDHNGSPPLQ